MNPTLQALLREKFFSFARKAILELEGTKLGHDPYLRYLARELDLFAGEETHRLIINLPPGHLKTLLASVSLAAWLLAHDPSLKIIIVTHAEHLSKTIARNIRTILQADWFNELFATRIRKGHAEVTDFGTTSGGGVFVSSFHGRITGRRAHVIIVDDPHDIDDELEQIEGTIESFNMVLLSRLNDRKTGRVLVVAHRVHERDLSAYLLRKKKKKWKHVVLPLVATEDQTYETASGIWRRRKGELLRPDVFGPEDLDEPQRSYWSDLALNRARTWCRCGGTRQWPADHQPPVQPANSVHKNGDQVLTRQLHKLLGGLHFAVRRLMMKIIHHDAQRSAAIASAGAATSSDSLFGVHVYSFIPTTLNSLFIGRFHRPRAAKPMNFRHFRSRAVGAVMKFPVLFPVSREFRTAVWDDGFWAEIFRSISLSSILNACVGSADRCAEWNSSLTGAHNSNNSKYRPVLRLLIESAPLIRKSKPISSTNWTAGCGSAGS
jgi:hypothetical protein